MAQIETTRVSTVRHQVKYVVVTPVRDEVRYIAGTIKSMVQQTVRPLRWVIVDDGSTDGTGELAESAVKTHPWIRLVRRANRGHRASGGGVVEAVNAGYANLDAAGPWDFIVKLDGDLSFDPDYFARCFAAFAADDRLGIGSGTVCRRERGALVVDALNDPPFHVRGASKIYRRTCWDAIGPLPPVPGWDTIDEVRANRLGWRTRTFGDINVIQEKATGEIDGRWRNWKKNGLANYMTGYHPAFMAAKCLKRSLHKPFLLEGVALASGFLSGYVRHLPRPCDEATIRYLRREQLKRLAMQPSIYR
jgi:glycosyltransferase involved in cell wall biosynthesis